MECEEASETIRVSSLKKSRKVKENGRRPEPATAWYRPTPPGISVSTVYVVESEKVC